jgi:tRNA1Val (adenine37-N6)-methyltransferase
MPNSYFQFKQFRIEQGQTAMKVTTEACLMGAWVASLDLQPARILDIGTGTGLLALMLAQRYDAAIDAIELDVQAAEQARANFQGSPWADRLHMIQGDVRTFAAQTTESYDLIISNPPFFARHQLSGKAKDQALHQESLSQQELLDAASKLLTREGSLAVLYPVYESGQLAELTQPMGFYRHHRMAFRDAPDRPLMREITVYSRQSSVSDHKVLTIKSSSGGYSKAFEELLRAYYLGL